MKKQSKARILVISNCCNMGSYSQATNRNIQNIKSKHINKPSLDKKKKLFLQILEKAAAIFCSLHGSSDNSIW